MSLNYASLLHVIPPSSLLLNSSRLDRRLDNDLIASARRADVSLLARPTHACTCYYKFPGNQGRRQPVWSWAAATIDLDFIFQWVIAYFFSNYVAMTTGSIVAEFVWRHSIARPASQRHFIFLYSVSQKSPLPATCCFLTFYHKRLRILNQFLHT